MRLPSSAHTSRPWRIHELTRDFRLEDVWALPTPGGRYDFPRLVQLIASGDPSRSPSRAARRSGRPGGRSGGCSLGPCGRRVWPGAADASRPPAGGSANRPSRPGVRRASVHLAVPDRRRVGGGDRQSDRSRSHAHRLGFDEEGRYRGELAVYVKPNGLLGTAYMAAIRPFRHLIVYPPMLRQIGQVWRRRA